jgi:23S rRNA (guanosine2251-2'-O)-methyltransferase
LTMWLYGRNVIREVLKAGKRKIYEIIALKGIEDADDIIKEAKTASTNVVFVDKKTIFEKTGTDKNQGIAANVEGNKSFTLDEFLEKYSKEQKIAVCVLDEIEDPHNLGAIIRSCEIFGVCGIILSSNRSAPVNDAVFKASSGALEYMDIVKVSNINQAILKLKDAGFWIYGFDLDAEKYLDEIDFDRKSALVFGNEGRGLKQLVRKNCDFLVKIRQKGKIASLNVSNAAAVAFYQLMIGKK